ncbi:hypothetical protein GmHk_02G004851 [Glycine max]|nr:hypothetical protein GmHk_02G004851 [Glycine max]
MGTRGCINYNPILAIRQLGYPMRGASSEESITPFIARGFSDPNARIFQGVRKAWGAVQRKDKEIKGSSNGIIDGYHKWLNARTQGLDWLLKLKVLREEEAETPEESEEVQALKAELERAQAVKEKFKTMTIKVRKECDELRDINVATAEALERETKRAQKEECGRNKFRGALLGSYSELKLRRAERDQSRVEGMILEDKLKACQRSKRSLSDQLSKMEENMWVIVDQYKEKLSLAGTHEPKLEDEYAKVSVLQAEREAKERAIDSLHREAMMWMDKFAFTLNGSQDLPRLLAKAKAMADVYSAPEEVHGLLDYCQHMIDLMAVSR